MKRRWWAMEPDTTPARTQTSPTRSQSELLASFLRWLQANGVQLCSSKIEQLQGSSEGFGVFCTSDNTEGVVMVTPLQLAITPMRILQDADLGSMYGKLFEDGDVDDRLLMVLFLMVERIRGPHSFWAPYLDVLPTKFGTPLWFTEKEFQELKGTALYNATNVQLKNLKALFAEKVKTCAEQFLSFVGSLEREATFEDFLWANCVFWTRALNIPFPHLFVFPRQLPLPVTGDVNSNLGEHSPRKHARFTSDQFEIEGELIEENLGQSNISTEFAGISNDISSTPENEQTTVWVEGLVPGIDFCNHDPKGVARWEVNGDKGHAAGVPCSMYLTVDVPLSADKEILISYGNKGNEELLFLYGFVLEDNPDEYLMVNFPKEALEQDSCADAKMQLLQEQGLSMRWLLPATLLQKGFSSEEQRLLSCKSEPCPSGYSWSGNRKPPHYLNQCIFPEETMSALRIVAMKEDELQTIVSMLQELSQSGLHRQPSDQDVRAAVWEVCGNTSALQLLTDLLAARMLDLEEGSGSEESDKELLESSYQDFSGASKAFLSKNVRACLIYRKEQKHLAKCFLKEAEHLFELCITEEQCQRKFDQ